MSSRATYSPRWSNQLTEQLLNYKSTTPSPPPPNVPSSLKRLHNDSGTASVSHPNQEIEKHKVQHDIPQLWANLAQQIPPPMEPNKKRTSVVATWAHEEDPQEEPEQTIGMFLFWCGFLCPVCWWIGSFWPRHADRQGKMAHRWQLINRIMSISFCILLILFLLAIGVWYHFAA